MSVYGIVVVVVFTEPVEDTIRIISARKANAKELEKYYEKIIRTDLKALASMTDEEIAYSDIPPLPEAFFKRVAVWQPQPKVSVTVDLDVDILKWFKVEADDWQSRIQRAGR